MTEAGHGGDGTTLSHLLDIADAEVSPGHFHVEVDDAWTVLHTLSMDVQITAAPVSPWLLQLAEVHRLADGFVLGTVHLFDEEDRLVAFSSQRATVRFL